MTAPYEDRQLQAKINAFAPQAEMMPAVVIIQQLEPFTSIFMTSRGLRELGITNEELRQMGPEYLQRFFNLEDTEDYLEKLKILLQNSNTEETFTFFQQVKIKGNEGWVWHIGSTRIFFLDEAGKPTHIVTTAIPVDKLKHIPNKAERLLAEKNFFHDNLPRFLTLGKREQEVLKLVALGKSSNKIGEELCISTQTVETHRKNIKNKLDISSTYEFTLYAHAFDLI